MTKDTLVARFWAKVDVRAPDECWEWTGSRSKKGYGSIKGNGKKSKTYKAHRISFEMRNGAINPDLMVLHSCDNPGCVNPSHLRQGTNADNMIDMYAKGRRHITIGEIGRATSHLRCGEMSEVSKLYESDVLEILASPEYINILAFRFGVDESLIGLIKSRKIWRHVKVDFPVPYNKRPNCRPGTAAPRAKLSQEQVDRVRRRASEGETKASLAKDYGLSQSSIGRIVNGKTYITPGFVPNKE